MARAATTVGEGSRTGRGVGRGREDGGRYARYSEEQIEILERVYAKCSNPTHLQRQQIMHDHPTLRAIDHKQLKVWFQNRRCRERQKKESGGLVLENKRLVSANKQLKEENNGLQKKLAQLMSENEDLRNHVLTLTSKTTTCGCGHQPEANNPQMPTSAAVNNNLLSLAEETRKEFLSKAIGTAMDWIPVPWLKLHGPNSFGTIYVPSTCTGVAARANVTIPLEPSKILEILKDRTTWSRMCRNMEVVAKYPADNEGTIELIYTQLYAPTLMAFARDFWTLRYTSVLDDGCFVVCEKSISGSDAGPSSPAVLEFVRGRMFASGYMIRSSGEGSTINLVDHWDLEASSVPELVRPLYESSEFVAKKMVLSAIHYIEHVANEKNGVEIRHSIEEPTLVRNMSKGLCRYFNDAINCFSEDGWTLMNADASNDVIMSYKQAKNYGVFADFGNIVCVKASLLLQNVSPAKLVSLLKERRTAWLDFDFASHSTAFTKAGCFAYPGLKSHHHYMSDPVVLGYSDYEDESLENIRFKYIGDRQLDIPPPRELHHLQICSGLEDVGFGDCSELIFAPIDTKFPNDAKLLSAGFRIYLLGSNAGTNSSANQTSVLLVAFQFPFDEDNLLEDVAAMARDYIRYVMSYVKSISHEALLPAPNPAVANPAMAFNSTSTQTFAFNLAMLMCQGYRSTLGVDMLGFNSQSAVPMLDQMQNHPYAIFCYSFPAHPVCIFANKAALIMMESTADKLQNLLMDKVLGGSNNLSLSAVLPTVLQQGYAILPPGNTLSLHNRSVQYEQGVMWQAHSPDDTLHFLALAFLGWSFESLI
ncbi:hypothetical protein ACS0TY_009383 [Phlomoides rotata]